MAMSSLCSVCNSYPCPGCTGAAIDEVVRLRVKVADLRAILADVHWDDIEDEWADQIREAFPTRSGSHDHYAEAMRMVGHRHSKGELVALVNWLLVRCDNRHQLASKPGA